MKRVLKDVVKSLVCLVVLMVAPLVDGLGSLRQRWPTERRLHVLARSPRARAAREAERERIRGLVGALGAVAGVEHVLTQVSDYCVRPSSFGLSRHSGLLLVCRIYARAYFVVREDITAVLPRIEAADVAGWQARGQGPDPHGSVEHALRWHRDGGIDADGRRMDHPCLSTPGARLSWDRPGILCQDPVPKLRYLAPLRVLEQSPPEADAARLLREARADGRGVVLELVLGANWTDHCQYHVVARGGFAGRGRL